MTSSEPRKNIIVIGGSYVGTRAVELLAQKLHATHRTLLIEQNTHFHHLFAFPRVAVVPGFERLAFIPFTSTFDSLPRNSTAVVHGRVTEVQPGRVILDSGDSVPYDFLVIATGTRLPPPGTLHAFDKPAGMEYFRAHQKHVLNAQKVVVVGGGAVGVQLATDIKDYYPAKHVTLVHSRDRLMHKFHLKMHEVLSDRMAELDVGLVLGERAVIPPEGFPLDSKEFEIVLQSGRKLTADFAILATGQIPRSELIQTLTPDTISSSGFIAVKRTLQVTDERYPNVFVIGDVADTPNQKTARSGSHHAEVVTENIAALVSGEEPRAEYKDSGMGIHMSLGMKRDLKFRQLVPEQEPMVNLSDVGTEDMHLKRVWERRAPGNKDYDS
ncbi:hypothetical protein K488DRAFT_52806 [Vararia minispora EC-137]|uniref:Uncharacterized protein n=1 Tax=Vararia minispora EC-137 TaxID=1314806 RepID=A0ACB8QIF7_9AGAM|nr:hypothetical protein K488DRAFT_52806 [Vararia minispora EC-137]